MIKEEILSEQPVNINFELSKEEVDIKAALKKKKVRVKIFNVSHVGQPSEQLIKEFGKANLRTSEDVWGSIDDYIDQRKSPPTNSLKIALLGLGERPEYPLSLVTNISNNPQTKGNKYFDPIDAAYNDVRGVDQSFAGDWVGMIHGGQAKLKPLDFPSLSEKQKIKLTNEIVIFLLNESVK